MSLPVSPDYLALSLTTEMVMGEVTLRLKRIAELRLPTGRLVAADPFVFMSPPHFELPLPCGVFPVVVSVLHWHDDQRVAFAGIRFRDSVPVAWEMLTRAGQDLRNLEEGHFFGYPVNSGAGCFIDAAAAKILLRKMKDDDEFFREMIAAMERTYVHTWSWLDMPFGEGNLVAFSSGGGDGVYANYAGFDAEGEISIVVTDFSVAPLPEIDDMEC
jgi:hypothetical protein